MKVTRYSTFDRLMDFMSLNIFDLKAYCEKYEISRSTAFRDMAHLRDFQNVEFKYNQERNIYERVKENT